MSAIFTQDLWSPGAGSAITGDSALLRPKREPGLPWWICGRVEGSASWPGCRSQGFEGILGQWLRGDQKSGLLAVLLTFYVYPQTDLVL